MTKEFLQIRNEIGNILGEPLYFRVEIKKITIEVVVEKIKGSTLQKLDEYMGTTSTIMTKDENNIKIVYWYGG